MGDGAAVNRERIREILSVMSPERVLDTFTDLLLTVPGAFSYLQQEVQHDVQQRKLFVRCLARDCTNDRLRELFTPFGEVDDAYAVQDATTNRCKGFGTVLMADLKGACAALEIPAKPFMDKIAHVYLAAATNKNDNRKQSTSKYPDDNATYYRDDRGGGSTPTHQWVPAGRPQEYRSDVDTNANRRPSPTRAASNSGSRYLSSINDPRRRPRN